MKGVRYNSDKNEFEQDAQPLVISNIDDLVEAKLEVHSLSKNHVRPRGHGEVFDCPTCNRISELTAQISKHQRDRAKWLDKVREEDKRQHLNLIEKISRFKRERRQQK